MIDYIDIWTKLLLDPEWRPGSRVLFNFTERKLDLTIKSELRERLMEFFCSNQELLNGSRIAVVDREVVNFHRQSFRYGLALRGIEVEFRYFDDEDAALRWLIDDDGNAEAPTNAASELTHISDGGGSFELETT